MLKHSLANYPLKFLGYVISPTKICLQFEEVTTKLRFKQGADYIKLPSTAKALAIEPTGTSVDILAVGCQMPVLKDMQHQLIHSYRTYLHEHSATYYQTYGADFMEFLIEIREGLDEIIHSR